MLARILRGFRRMLPCPHPTPWEFVAAYDLASIYRCRECGARIVVS